MKLVFVFLSFLSVVLSSCPCDKTLSLEDAYHAATDVVFVSTASSYPALVFVEEVFKGSYKVNEALFVAVPCGKFPLITGEKGVLFTTPSSTSAAGHANLVACAPSGPLSEVEKTKLRSGFTCTDPATNIVHASGDVWTVDCNVCTCSGGEATCSKTACVPSRGCSTSSGGFVAEGDSISQDCNTCTCAGGALACTAMACDNAICYDGSIPRYNGDVWDSSGCSFTCENGVISTVPYSCYPPPSSSSNRFFIIGISLASGIVVLVIVTVAAIIRNKLRAKAQNDGILLNDLNEEIESDEWDKNNNNNNNDNNNAYTNNFNGSYAQPFGSTNFATQSYPTWGGQPLATTPMVMMTQTGEPVVVQVAYM